MNDFIFLRDNIQKDAFVDKRKPNKSNIFLLDHWYFYGFFLFSLWVPQKIPSNHHYMLGPYGSWITLTMLLKHKI